MFGLSSLYMKLIGGLVVALLVIGLVADRGRWMRRAHTAEAENSASCDAARKASNVTKLDCKQVPQQIAFLGEALNAVRQTTAAAKAADAAHATEVESHQNIASQESSHDYQAQIAAVRADYAERLRRASAANSRGSGKPPVSSASPSASGPDAAPAQDGLPPADALTATEQAIQLKSIQQWACKVGLASKEQCHG